MADLAGKLTAVLADMLRSAQPCDERPMIHAFVAFLRRAELLHLGDRIVEAFEEALDRDAATWEVEAAHDLSLPHMRTMVNPSLVAGARVRSGQRVADATIRRRLEELRRSILRESAASFR